MKLEQIKEMTEKATEQLAAELSAGRSETLLGYLKAISRFHRYSLHNAMLIALQKPCASYVAGFHTWRKLGRQVQKGEKAILIMAPLVRHKTDRDTKEDSATVVGFRAASVFDISQTDGQALPSIGCVTGDPQGHIARLQSFAQSRRITVEYSDNIAPARGISYGGGIAILPGQHPAEEFATIVHELAHELLHRNDRRNSTSKTMRETEAEATAFVVCHAIGLETASASSDYIQLWNGDAQLLHESLTYIRQAASEMLAVLTDE